MTEPLGVWNLAARCISKINSRLPREVIPVSKMGVPRDNGFNDSTVNVVEG